jgi:ABC-type uncharacterized transport system involved in gliding motility auxiliary subunit
MKALQKLLWLLAPLGVVLMIGAWAWGFFKQPLPGGTSVYVIVGAALVLLHLLLAWEDIANALGRRQMAYGAFSLVLVAAVAGILIGVNWYVARHTKRWDVTKNQRFSLSEATKKSLANLKDDVKILYFQSTAELGAGRDRMKEYQEASKRIQVEFVNPVQSPARAREYEVTMVPTLVVERGTRREKISNDSEQDITNALIKVTRDVQKTVCFVEGEGERTLEDSDARGYSSVKAALGRSQYQTKPVTLLREGRVPADCTVAVLAGPVADLSEPVVGALRDYVKGGGRLLALAEPELKDKTPQYVALLKEWSLEAGPDVVLDVSPGTLRQTGPETPLGVRYPTHEITKDLRGLASAFQTARSVKAGAGAPGVFAQSLVETDVQAWGETDFTGTQPVFDEGKDTPGPVSLGAVATLTAPSPSPEPSPAASPGASPSPAPSPEAPRRDGRVVAFGDADFASNAFFAIQGNRDLFLNSVAWLAEDPDLITIRPKDPEDQRMFLTGRQQVVVFGVALVVWPALFVVLGVVVWWLRRS